ncbi:MAG: hypothetical protein NHB14_20840 [Desulfosporosinus sp.]|nr:hypothetical protein [Desulfosporosinus sp.]
MNQRQRKKKLKAQVLVKATTKTSLQEAWNIVAEALESTDSPCFFVDRDYMRDRRCWRLHDLTGFLVLSKPVRGQ